MKQLCYLTVALAVLAVTGCQNSVVKHKAKLEAQWKIQIRALASGDKAAFESVLNASTKAQPNKVNATFGIVNGLAKALKITENDVRIENVEFNPDFTLATVKTAYKAPKEPSGWKAFDSPEIWVWEKGQWLRQL